MHADTPELGASSTSPVIPTTKTANNTQAADSTQLEQSMLNGTSPTSRAQYKPVKALDPETARKIAAGEVIDRPAAVIRELLDNALDAGASKIQVEITAGGIDSIRVTDNGCGMSREDLAICTNTHTTSKITVANDLLALHSLGFRGEALSSIKAVSNLEITSTREGPAAWKLQLGKIIPSRLNSGTVVHVERLFENFPARKQFLKRAAAETTLCRTIFLDKALPHFQTEMRFIADGSLRFLLPPAQSLKERCIAAFSFKEPESLFFEVEGSGDSFSFHIVLGSPDVLRTDKRAIMIFVNGRRISEFGLVQAIEYGSEGYFPNGAHPVAFLFLTVAPARVDFNIHPAKKEARFQDYSAIHHAITSTVSEHYRQHTTARLLQEKYDPNLTSSFNFAEEHSPPHTGGTGGSAWSERTRLYTQSLLQKHGTGSGAMPQKPPENGLSNNNSTKHASSDIPAEYHDKQDGHSGALYHITASAAVPYSVKGRIIPPPAVTNTTGQDADSFDAEPPYMQSPKDIPPPNFRLLGQVAGTFIAVEKDDALYLVDQHAAHERIIFEKLRDKSGGIQELLIPYRIITTSESEDTFIKKHKDTLKDAGFTLSDEGQGVWQVTTVPARWTGTERDLIRDITGVRKNTQDILYQILASAACRAACKDHAILDPIMQQRIVAQAFELPEPICPHGRPIWIVLTREELFKRIKRTS